MCMIIYNPKNESINHDIIDETVSSNPDGYGIYCLETGELKRTMRRKTARKWLKNATAPYVFHARYATHGRTKKENTHPFTVGRYLVFMNGVISGLSESKRNDTKVVAEAIQHLELEQMGPILNLWSARFVVIDTESGEMLFSGNWHKDGDTWYSRDPSPCYHYGNYKTCNAGYSSSKYASQKRIADSGFASSDYWDARYENAHRSQRAVVSEGIVDAYGMDRADCSLVPMVGNVFLAIAGNARKGMQGNHILAGSEYLGEVETLQEFQAVKLSDGETGIIWSSSDGQFASNHKLELWEVPANKLGTIDTYFRYKDRIRSLAYFYTLDNVCELCCAYAYFITELPDNPYFVELK